MSKKKYTYDSYSTGSRASTVLGDTRGLRGELSAKEMFDKIKQEQERIKKEVAEDKIQRAKKREAEELQKKKDQEEAEKRRVEKEALEARQQAQINQIEKDKKIQDKLESNVTTQMINDKKSQVQKLTAVKNKSTMNDFMVNLVARKQSQLAYGFDLGLGKNDDFKSSQIKVDPGSGRKIINEGGKNRFITPEEEARWNKEDADKYKLFQDNASTTAKAYKSIGSAVGFGGNLFAQMIPAGLKIVGGVADKVQDIGKRTLLYGLTRDSRMFSGLGEDLMLDAYNLKKSLGQADYNISKFLVDNFGKVGALDQEHLAKRKNEFDTTTAKDMESVKKAVDRKTKDNLREVKARDMRGMDFQDKKNTAELEGDSGWADRQGVSLWDQAKHLMEKPSRLFDYLAEDISRGINNNINSEDSNTLHTNYLKDNNITSGDIIKPVRVDMSTLDLNEKEYKNSDGQIIRASRNRLNPGDADSAKKIATRINTEELDFDEAGNVRVDENNQPIYKNTFGFIDRVPGSIDLGAIFDMNFIQGAGAQTVGSLLGFMGGGGVANKLITKASFASPIMRAAVQVEEAAGATAGVTRASKGIKGLMSNLSAPKNIVKMDDIAQHSLQNYVMNDVEGRQNSDQTKKAVLGDLIDEQAELNSFEKATEREAQLKELGLKQGDPGYDEMLLSIKTKQRADFMKENPEMGNILKSQANTAAELALHANRLAMASSINETAQFFKRTRLLSTSGKLKNPLLSVLGNTALTAIDEGGEELIGNYSDKYGKGLVLDNNIYSLKDFIANDITSKEGLETGILGALAGNAMGGIMGVGSTVNQVKEFKEQKKALADLQKISGPGNTFNSFLDIIEHNDRLKQQSGITARVEELINKGTPADLAEAKKLTNAAFTAFSFYQASQGLSSEAEKSLSTMYANISKGLSDPDTSPGAKEGIKEELKNIERAIKYNKVISENFDKHAGFQNRNKLASNRLRKVQNQDILEDQRAELDALTNDLKEGSEAYYNARLDDLQLKPGSEEAENEREKALEDYENEEGSFGNSAKKLREAISRGEEKIRKEDIEYHKDISATHQKELIRVRQDEVAKKIKNAKSEEDLQAILDKEVIENINNTPSSVRKAILNTKIRLQAEKNSKESGFDVGKYTKEGDLFKDKRGRYYRADKREDGKVVPGELMSRSDVRYYKARVEEAEFNGEEYSDPELNPDSLELFPEVEKIQPVNPNVDTKLAEVVKKTQESGGEYTVPEQSHEVNVDGVQLSLFEEEGNNTGNLNDELKKEAERVRDQKVQEEAKKQRKKSKPADPRIVKKLATQAQALSEALETPEIDFETAATEDDLGNFNKSSKVDKIRDNLKRTIDVFVDMHFSRNGVNPTYGDLLAHLLKEADYSTVLKVHPYLKDIWIDKFGDTPAINDQITEAFDKFFGLETVVKQMTSLVQDLAEAIEDDIVESDGEVIVNPKIEATVTPKVIIKEETTISEVEESEDLEKAKEEDLKQGDQNSEEPTALAPEEDSTITREVIGYTPEGRPIVNLNGYNNLNPTPRLMVPAVAHIHYKDEEGNDKLENINQDSGEVDRSGTVDIDNLLNPALTAPGTELEITVFDPAKQDMTWAEVPFIEYDPVTGRRVGVQGEPGTVANFQEFIDKHNLTPEDEMYQDNVPLFVKAKVDGKDYTFGTAIPPVSFWGLSSVKLPNMASPEEAARKRGEVIKEGRENNKALRARVLAGNSKFKIGERFSGVHLKRSTSTMDGTIDGKPITEVERLSVEDPNDSIVGYADVSSRYDDDKELTFQTVDFFIEGSGNKKVSFEKMYPNSIINEKSRTEFFKYHANKKNKGKGLAVKFLYVGMVKNPKTGVMQKVYNVVTLTSHGDNKLIEKLDTNKRTIRAVLRVYLALAAKARGNITPEQQAELDKHTPEKQALMRAAAMKLKDKYRIPFANLKMNGFSLSGSGLSELLDRYTKTRTDKNGNELKDANGNPFPGSLGYQSGAKGKDLPMIDPETFEVTNYESPHNGKEGYDAMIADGMAHGNIGHNIADRTNVSEEYPNGAPITVYDSAPRMTIVPVIEQGESVTGTSEVQRKPRVKSAFQKAIQVAPVAPVVEVTEEKPPITEESPEAPTPPTEAEIAFASEQEINDIIASEVQYYDENDVLCP